MGEKPREHFKNGPEDILAHLVLRDCTARKSEEGEEDVVMDTKKVSVSSSSQTYMIFDQGRYLQKKKGGKDPAGGNREGGGLGAKDRAGVTRPNITLRRTRRDAGLRFNGWGGQRRGA